MGFTYQALQWTKMGKICMSKATLWSRNVVSTYNSSSPAVEAAIELNMAENMPAPPITPLPT